MLRSAGLVAVLLIGCAAGTAPTSPTPSASVVLHWMSFQHHAEPRYQLLFEGGEAGSFTELRLLATDGTAVDTAKAVPSATETIRMCSGSKASPPTQTYGALRVTLNLASDQFSDVLRYPERYRVEVRTADQWRPVRLVHDCDAQE